MYQVTFSDESAKTFQALPQERQLQLAERLSQLTPEVLAAGKEPIGVFKRADTLYYRCRIDDFRFYFTLKADKEGVADTIHCIFILNKNSWADFRLRNNLEKLSDAEVESNPEFLEMLKDS